MSIRARSALGAVLVAGGLLGMIGAAIIGRRPVFWGSLAAAACGVGLIAWAVRDVARAIGDARTKYDALLRAELPPGKKDRPPAS
jgi:hypothetical protein